MLDKDLRFLENSLVVFVLSDEKKDVLLNYFFFAHLKKRKKR